MTTFQHAAAFVIDMAILGGVAFVVAYCATKTVEAGRAWLVEGKATAPLFRTLLAITLTTCLMTARIFADLIKIPH